jgi:hypothetical protein
MAVKRSRRRGGRRFVVNVHKPHGVIQPRVQKVGPEHFGIVSVDCAKARFKWMLCDFYGNVLIPPTTVEHNRPELDLVLTQLKAARAEHDLRDLIVAVERTGRYHHIPQRLFAAHGNEVFCLRRLKLRTFHAGIVLGFFTSYLLPFVQSVFSNVWKPSSSAPGWFVVRCSAYR